MVHSSGFLAIVADAKTRVREIEMDEFLKMRAENEEFLLIDVREDSEYAVGHGAGAIHLSKGIIERDIETRVPDKDTKMVLYCGGGYRSALASDHLMQMGYRQVLSLNGGWRAWQEAGLPIELPS